MCYNGQVSDLFPKKGALLKNSIHATTRHNSFRTGRLEQDTMLMTSPGTANTAQMDASEVQVVGMSTKMDSLHMRLSTDSQKLRNAYQQPPP